MRRIKGDDEDARDETGTWWRSNVTCDGPSALIIIIMSSAYLLLRSLARLVCFLGKFSPFLSSSSSWLAQGDLTSSVCSAYILNNWPNPLKVFSSASSRTQVIRQEYRVDDASHCGHVSPGRVSIIIIYPSASWIGAAVAPDVQFWNVPFFPALGGLWWSTRSTAMTLSSWTDPLGLDDDY